MKNKYKTGRNTPSPPPPPVLTPEQIEEQKILAEKQRVQEKQARKESLEKKNRQLKTTLETNRKSRDILIIKIDSQKAI